MQRLRSRRAQSMQRLKAPQAGLDCRVGVVRLSCLQQQQSNPDLTFLVDVVVAGGGGGRWPVFVAPCPTARRRTWPRSTILCLSLLTHVADPVTRS